MILSNTTPPQLFRKDRRGENFRVKQECVKNNEAYNPCWKGEGKKESAEGLRESRGDSEVEERL